MSWSALLVQVFPVNLDVHGRPGGRTAGGFGERNVHPADLGQIRTQGLLDFPGGAFAFFAGDEVYDEPALVGVGDAEEAADADPSAAAGLVAGHGHQAVHLRHVFGDYSLQVLHLGVGDFQGRADGGLQVDVDGVRVHRGEELHLQNPQGRK
jgi:hypothetical protein